MSEHYDEPVYDIEHPAWRPAPRARSATMTLYSWQDPAWVFFTALVCAAPFVIAALFSPALLSLAPTVDMIAPISHARAVAAGAAPIAQAESPFNLMLLLAGDVFFDAPGRIHLAAKAFAAALVVYPLAYFSAARFPAAQTVLMVAGVAAFAAGPFAGPTEIALAFFIVLATALLCAPADERRSRARYEGALSGAILFILWTAHPVFALLGFLALSACPFVTGRGGLDRYVSALFAAVLLAGAAEVLARGAEPCAGERRFRSFGAPGQLASAAGVWGLAGVAVSTGIVLFASAVFGGGEHAKGWATAAVFLVLSFIGARIAGAQTLPLFVLAGAMASLSVYSPFYDGVFRAHDRASIAIAGSVAALSLFWTAALVIQSAGQFTLQYRAAATAPADIRAELGLVQPGGPTIARWIEEGRFSTPEARELFALAPVDQSAMLLEAASRARALSDEGVEVAILTGPDIACVIASSRDCAIDGPAAAGTANVVFVPRLDVDAGTAAAKGRSEALLYTQFKMVERTPLWEIWVRRGYALPASLPVSTLNLRS
ncbi:MAG: hypothetical protein R3C40_07205 [Parvularculaceae bacterium]